MCTGGDRVIIDRKIKAIFGNNVEIIKLGNLVPNFDSTSRVLFDIKNRTSHQYVTLHGISGNKVNARTRYNSTLKQKNELLTR